MQPRTCPNCGYKYSIGQYLRKAASADLWTEWTCPNCGTSLRVEKSGRRRLAITNAALFLVLFLLRYYLDLPVAVYMGFLFLLIFGTIFLFTQDHFVRADTAE